MNKPTPEELQKLYVDYVFIQSGQALVNAQYVERVCKLMCAFMKTKGVNIDLDDLLSGNVEKTRATLGRISSAFRNDVVFSNQFQELLDDYVQRRNHIIHNLFFDTFYQTGIKYGSPSAAEYLDVLSKFVEDGSHIIESLFGAYHVIGLHLTRDRSIDADAQILLEAFAEFEAVGTAALKADFFNNLVNRYGSKT